MKVMLSSQVCMSEINIHTAMIFTIVFLIEAVIACGRDNFQLFSITFSPNAIFHVLYPFL